jgi:hypothetical protein
VKQSTVHTHVHTPASKDRLQRTAAAAAADSWSSLLQPTAAGAAKAESSRGGGRTDHCSLLTTHGLTACKHMCVSGKDNNNELLGGTPPLGQQGIKSVQKHTLE